MTTKTTRELPQLAAPDCSGTLLPDVADLLSEASGELEEAINSLMTSEIDEAEDVALWALNLESLVSEISALVASIQSVVDDDFTA